MKSDKLLDIRDILYVCKDNYYKVCVITEGDKTHIPNHKAYTFKNTWDMRTYIPSQHETQITFK